MMPPEPASSLAIVMPVLNEAAGIEAALRALAPLRARGARVVVADGGSADDTLATELLAAGEKAADLAWRMPLDEEYDEALKSNFADMGNVGGRAGGAITAAMFLKRFTAKLRWAHLDIAGTAWKSGAAKGATGRPVGLLTHWVLSQAK